MLGIIVSAFLGLLFGLLIIYMDPCLSIVMIRLKIPWDPAEICQK
jgi:hypothetical protein